MIPNIQIEIIDRNKALTYLAKSKGNRTINRRAVDSLKKLISEGEWKFQISPILFNSDGTLIDGHHRLTAIAESNETLQVLVMHNIPKESQRYIDTGRPRKYYDTLSYKGLKHTRYIEACLRLILAVINGGRKTTTFKDLEEAFTKYQDIVCYPVKGDYTATTKLPLVLGHLVLGLEKEIMDQVQTGYNIAPGSIADKICKILESSKYRFTGEKPEIILNILELIYRYKNGLPYTKVKLNDETIRAKIISSIINHNSTR